ncbi:MAG: hypothetical protein Q4Q20_05300 [Methanocorpusculum sp.]|nr:hypothetical protein [Methanocorpusculum sp.]
MDELQKTEARNYLVAGGLLLFGLILVLIDFGLNPGSDTTLSMISPIGGIMLLIIGIILLVLHKRNIAGISFILSGVTNIVAGFSLMFFSSGFNCMYAIATIVCLMWGIILFFSKDRHKWIFAPLCILFGVQVFAGLFPDTEAGITFRLVCDIISIVIAVYFALAAGFERISLPGRCIITADETIEFKQSGSSVGYVLFAGLAVAYVLMYLGVPAFSATPDAVHPASFGFGTMLILIGILLFAIGKMRFTPVMFFLLGIAEMLAWFSSGPMLYALGAFVVITGIFAMLRKESRILPGLMLIIYGASFFISVWVTGTAISPIASVLLNIIPAAIAVYLAVATLSQRKIPLF